MSTKDLASENRAVCLWRLERLYESEFCRRLIELSGNRNKFLQEIKLKKADIMKKKNGSTGNGLFRYGDLKDIGKLDVAELLVITNNTNLCNLVEQNVKDCSNIVRKVRNYLAHCGQEFGVEEDIYQENVEKLVDCLNKLNVDQNMIDEKLSMTIIDREKNELKDHQRQSNKMKILQCYFIHTYMLMSNQNLILLLFPGNRDLMEHLVDDMQQVFADAQTINIGDYIGELALRKVISPTESDHIKGHHARGEKNVVCSK